MNAKTMPVINSTIGYCQEIFSPQSRHLADSKIKLRSGTLSNHLIFFLQCGQCERSKRDSTALSRYTTAFKKLPIIRPKMRKMMVIYSNYLDNFINYIIAQTDKKIHIVIFEIFAISKSLQIDLIFPPFFQKI